MAKGKGEKVFEALAMAALPEHAQISLLASQLVKERRPVELEDARAVIRELYPRHGELEKMAVLLVGEVNRQRPLRNARRAVALASELANRPIGERLNTPAKRKERKIESAIKHFGDYIETAFSDDVLAMLELLKHDHRVYEVKWLDFGVRPATAAVVHVVVTGEKTAYRANFLLYKTPGAGTIRCAELGEGVSTVRDAWIYQVPPESIPLRRQGWVFRTDFDAQTLVANAPGATDNEGELVFPWRGRHEEPGEA